MNKNVLAGVAALALVSSVALGKVASMHSGAAVAQGKERLILDTANYDRNVPDHFWPRTVGKDPYGLFYRVKEAIESARLRGDFKVGDFEKLDFSLPDEKTYGDNPQYEVFNPKGPFKYSYGELLKDGKLIAPEDLKQSTEPDSRVMFVVIRGGADDGVDDNKANHLYGVVTDIKPEVCKSFYMIQTEKTVSGTDLHKALKPLTGGYVKLDNLKLDQQPRFVFPAVSYCLEDVKGKWFYFGRILTVYKGKGETKWRM